MSDSFPILPKEIWIEIACELGRPSHPLAYRLNAECVHALTRLCLVNTVFNAFTEPILYSRISIAPCSLESFRKAVETSDDKPHTNKGKLVKSLAFSELNTLAEDQDDEAAWQIRQILAAVRSSLQRLFLDAYFNDFAPYRPLLEFTIFRNLASLPVIEEFCVSSYSIIADWIPDTWKMLKRLAFAKPIIARSLLAKLRKLEELETCILAWPSGALMESELFKIQDLVQMRWGTEKLRELVVLHTEKEALFVRRLKEAGGSTDRQQEPETAAKSALKIMEVPEVAHLPFYEDRWAWFSQSILDGTIWERDRQTWPTFQKRLDTQYNFVAEV